MFKIITDIMNWIFCPLISIYICTEMYTQQLIHIHGVIHLGSSEVFNTEQDSFKV